MTRNALGPAALFALAGALLMARPADADAQYFGRNKVQYERFDWRIERTPHFDMYHYPAESLATHDAARMAERWYARLSDNFRHTFDRKSLVFYADQPDFQQTNVIGDQLTEGTGGVTEGLRTRVVMPHTPLYADTDHVLGHELVHVFQYSVAESGPGGLQRLNALPLWLVEGMAEYLSLGRDNSLTALGRRAAAERDRLPTIKQLTTDPRFFPYRYGQALWAYVGGRWGDRAIADVYRTSLRVGFEDGIKRVLGVSTDSLSKDWIAATRRAYLPGLEGRTRPNQAGDPVLQTGRKSGEMNLAPTVSPDGSKVAFYARRGLFEIELFVADALTGRVIRKLASPTSDSHFDAITFISSSGAWSPDNNQFAFIAQVEGNHEIAILDANTSDIQKRIRVPLIGAISSIAWSPDGRTMAFSGQQGGVSNLYLLDIAAGSVRQLTNDRHADIQPAWSPDGRTLVFSSDRGPNTSFETMVFSELQLATIDVASGAVTVLPAFTKGKHLNPQYSPDGRDVFFISDADGYNDIYRYEIATRGISRVTRLSTGVSGITAYSPAMSVAPSTGRMLFSVFEDQGYAVYGLDAARTRGEPVMPSVVVASTAGLLPPGDTPGRSTVTSYLRDPLTGLATGTDFTYAPYRAAFSLDAVGQPTVGVQAGGPFGTGVAGGVSFLFGDQLSDRQIGVAVQANGQIQDIGGQVQYLNLRNRLNWGASLQHIPFQFGSVGFSQQPNGQVTQDLYLQRIFLDQAALQTAYPFSSTRRVELSTAATRIGYSTQVLRSDLFGNPISQESGGPSPDPIYYGSASLAYVGDNSYSAFTNPIQGSRFRFEVSPLIGTINYNTITADYRKYAFARPFTFAVRGLHYGRYGRDSEDSTRLFPLFLGEEMLVRGYSYGSFDPVLDCPPRSNECPSFSRLFGSRLAMASAEFRIPLFGVPEYGLINFPYLPLTLSPFVDAGVAWDSRESPTFSGDTNKFRIPVVSAGLSARVNLLGYAVIEAYYARPFQRPGRGWVYGIQLAPGW